MNMTTLSLALALIPAACLLAQQPGNVVSPELLPDHRATLRIRAPKAAEVTLTADWIPAGTTEKLTKDDAGVWSLTVGPLEPGIYIYSFTVDGAAMADPVNPRIKLRARTSA